MPTWKSRLHRLEQQHRPQPSGYELWLEDGDELTGPTGERITQAEFERRYPDPIDISSVKRQPLRVVINRLLPRSEAE